MTVDDGMRWGRDSARIKHEKTRVHEKRCDAPPNLRIEPRRLARPRRWTQIARGLSTRVIADREGTKVD
jgi:hypothetical protein